MTVPGYVRLGEEGNCSLQLGELQEKEEQEIYLVKIKIALFWSFTNKGKPCFLLISFRYNLILYF